MMGTTRYFNAGTELVVRGRYNTAVMSYITVTARYLVIRYAACTRVRPSCRFELCTALCTYTSLLQYLLAHYDVQVFTRDRTCYTHQTVPIQQTGF